MEIVTSNSSEALIGLVPFLFVFLWLGYLIINPQNNAPKVSSPMTRLALGAVIVSSVFLLILANRLVAPQEIPTIDEQVPAPRSMVMELEPAPIE